MFGSTSNIIYFTIGISTILDLKNISFKFCLFTVAAILYINYADTKNKFANKNIRIEACDMFCVLTKIELIFSLI
jgi:hypothetical protein